MALEAVLRLAPPRWLHERMHELSAGEPYAFGTDRGWPIIRDDGVFRQFVPESSFVVRHYEYEHPANIDELGGRATPHSDDTVGLLPVLGDSFTFGIGVQDPETFVSLLAEHSSHRLLNLGMPGSALHNQLDIIAARHSALGYPEMYLFCMFMGNDLADIWKSHIRVNRVDAIAAKPTDQDFLWRLNNYVYHDNFLKRVYSIQFVRQKILTIMNKDSPSLMNPVYQMMRNDTNHLDESLRYFQKELERLKSMSLRKRFGFAFVLIPDVHQINPERFDSKSQYYGLNTETLDPGRVSRAISSTLRGDGIPHIDISDCMSRTNPSGSLYYVQDNHLTPAGHRAAASCILKADPGREILNSGNR